MTRKCALCKGTNYKRMYSFFSAPKDPEIRKKWQEVIPIANYTVTDDTFVCSKHFRASDIVTHWVSGVPPNVVRIKYKKFRLRNGAIPSLNFEGDNDTVKNSFIDDTNSITDQMDFLIPREKDSEFSYRDSEKRIDSPITFARYNVEDQRNTYFNKSERIPDCNVDSSRYILTEDGGNDSSDSGAEEDKYVPLDDRFSYNDWQKQKCDDDQVLEICDEIENKPDNCENKSPEPERSSAVYLDGKFGNVKPDTEQDAEIFCEVLKKEEADPLQLHTECSRNGDEEDLENGEMMRRNVDNESPESGSCETMLFEDLLEIYTEVTLPRGWTYVVTSKGHATTVVYLSMSTSSNHVPVVEKEVYVKNDMVMRCGVGSREINPFHHDLLKDGRNINVNALSDIEELVDELDRRHVCEGGPTVKNIQDYGETRVAYVDGGKLRHKGCPLIINNGSSKCSKCLSLNVIFFKKINRVINNRQNCERLLDVKKIENSLKKLTRRNQRLEKMTLSFRTKFKLLLNNSKKTLKNTIDSSKMPEIQKLMVRECLKASVVDNKKHVRYSETWIFLCLLLYVESPRMYKYISVNNYMALPTMLTIRKYLIQIKSNPQFYSLFQRSVEPYQPLSKRDEEEPT